MIRKLVLATALCLSSGAVFAQDAPAPLPFNAQGRQLLLRMCDVARWASQIEFAGACDAIKNVMAEADKQAAAAKAPAPVPEVKDDQPK